MWQIVLFLTAVFTISACIKNLAYRKNLRRWEWNYRGCWGHTVSGTHTRANEWAVLVRSVGTKNDATVALRRGKTDCFLSHMAPVERANMTQWVGCDTRAGKVSESKTRFPFSCCGPMPHNCSPAADQILDLLQVPPVLQKFCIGWICQRALRRHPR